MDMPRSFHPHPVFLLSLVEDLASRVSQLNCLNKASNSILQDLLRAAMSRDDEARTSACSAQTGQSDERSRQTPSDYNVESRGTSERDTAARQASGQLSSAAKQSLSLNFRKPVAGRAFQEDRTADVPSGEGPTLVLVESLLASLQQYLDQQFTVTRQARALFESCMRAMQEKLNPSSPQKKGALSHEGRSQVPHATRRCSPGFAVEVSPPLLRVPDTRDFSGPVPFLTPSNQATPLPRLVNHLSLLKLCSTLVESMEKDVRFKQEVKDELRHFAPVGVFRAALAAWLAEPFSSEQQVLVEKVRALVSRCQ